MAEPISLLESFLEHGEWANRKLWALCAGLTDEQLDQQRDMGFGSLRNTLFHILAAEEIWLERWQDRPWRPFDTDAGGRSLEEIAERLERVAAARRALVAQERADGWRRVCVYKNAQGNAFQNPLGDLVWHVANHGIHHRAQALNYLRSFDRRVPGGLDYIFFRLAYPATAQDEPVAAGFRQYGLEIATGPGRPLSWDRAFVERYFAYADWANQHLLAATESLAADELDRPRAMGMDTLRRTMTHLVDAEQWWLKNWTIGPSAFEKLPETTSLADIRQAWQQVVAQRNAFVASLDDASAARVVTALIGPSPVHFAVVESLAQLCCHGTHHRAQWINMLRQSGVKPPGVDVIVWLRK